MLRNSDNKQAVTTPIEAVQADAILDRIKAALATDADIQPAILIIDSSEATNAHLQEDQIVSMPLDRRQPSPDINDDAPAAAHNDCAISMLCLLPYVPAVFNALNEAASDALSLYEANNKSIYLLASASGITFMASLELTGQSTASNIKEILSILSTRKRPNDWPALSRVKILSVATIATGFAIWCALSDTAQAYDFIESIGSDYKIAVTPQSKNYWHIASAAVASGSAVTTLLTDSYETGKVMYNLAAGNIAPHANRASACVAPFVSSLCIFGAFTGALQTHSSIKDILKLQSTAAIAGLGAACTINMASSLCFSGGAVLEQVDDLFRYIPEQKFEPAKIAAFLTSLGLALFLSYVKRQLNIGYYREFANEDLNLPQATTPDYLFETLAWVNFLYEVLLVTASLNPQMMHLFSHIANQIGALLDCLTKPCQTHPASQSDYPPATLADDAFVDIRQNQDIESGVRPSQAGLFAPERSASTDEFRIPRRQPSGGCPCTIM